MKKALLFILAILFFNSSFAQAPETFKFQAIIKKNNNNVVKNEVIGVEVSIYQSALNGTLVYSETFNPTTSLSGMINLEIGNGTSSFGLFSAIPWGDGTYFMEVSVDVEGGTNYNSMGGSQLLSVPYALYAKTAENVIENQTLSDVVALDNTANSQLKSVSDPTDAQDAATKAYVDGLIADLEDRLPAYIGEFREGGIVFWVNPVDNTHGLVCAIEDQNSGIQWYNGSIVDTEATGYAIGTGSVNTDAIIAAQGTIQTDYAAGLARAFGGSGFNDWFLPSIDELNQMYVNKVAINTTATANGGTVLANFFYWSSTMEATGSAWWQDFIDGDQFQEDVPTVAGVRAIRTF